jgi:hypothetical protein
MILSPLFLLAFVVDLIHQQLITESIFIITSFVIFKFVCSDPPPFFLGTRSIAQTSFAPISYFLCSFLLFLLAFLFGTYPLPFIASMHHPLMHMTASSPPPPTASGCQYLGQKTFRTSSYILLMSTRRMVDSTVENYLGLWLVSI